MQRELDALSETSKAAITVLQAENEQLGSGRVQVSSMLAEQQEAQRYQTQDMERLAVSTRVALKAVLLGRY